LMFLAGLVLLSNLMGLLVYAVLKWGSR